MACHSGNLRTSSRLRSIWDSHHQLRRHGRIPSIPRRRSSQLRQVTATWLAHWLLGPWVGALFCSCCARSSLACARKCGSATLSYALSVTLHGHSAHCPLCRRKACAMFSRISSNVNFVRFERLTYDLEEYRLENVFQLLKDTVRHLVFTTREHEDVVVVVALLNGAGFNAQSRTSDKQQFHLVLVEIDTNVRDMLPERTL